MHGPQRRQAIQYNFDTALTDAQTAMGNNNFTEAQARVEYLRARQDWNVKNRELDELNRTCAITRYQSARLTAVRKVKVPGSERYDPKDFERQVKQCEGELADRKKGAQPQRERMEKARAEWEKKRDVVARKTFDARASPFVEKL